MLLNLTQACDLLNVKVAGTRIIPMAAKAQITYVLETGILVIE